MQDASTDLFNLKAWLTFPVLNVPSLLYIYIYYKPILSLFLSRDPLMKLIDVLFYLLVLHKFQFSFLFIGEYRFYQFQLKSHLNINYFITFYCIWLSRLSFHMHPAGTMKKYFQFRDSFLQFIINWFSRIFKFKEIIGTQEYYYTKI